jgi:hypothetical protein
MKEELNLMLANYKLKWVNLVLEKGLSRKEVVRLSDHILYLISPIIKTDKALNSFVFIHYLRVEFHHLFLPPNFPQCI